MLLNLKDPFELPLSKLALAGFAAEAPDAQRDPAPWEAVLLIASSLAELDGAEGLAAARACVLAFEACLRPSEVLSIRSCDVTVLAQQGVNQYPRITVRIAPSAPDTGERPQSRTKSGEYDDSVIIGDAASIKAHRGWVALLLSQLKSELPPSSSLCCISLSRWERLFVAAAARCGLSRLRLTPHCLRHGAASSDFASKLRSLDEIQRRGRWKSQLSLKRYEKSGRLARQFDLLSTAQVTKAKALASTLPRLLAPIGLAVRRRPRAVLRVVGQQL